MTSYIGAVLEGTTRMIGSCKISKVSEACALVPFLTVGRTVTGGLVGCASAPFCKVRPKIST